MNLYYYRLKIDPGFIHSDHAYQEYMRGDHHNKTWVDLGCGTNPFISEYKVNFNHAIGIDSDFHALRRAEKPACCADITQLPVKDESVDLTSSYMVFEHVTNPQSATNAIFRILRPGGMFICCTVSRKYWVSRLNTVLNEQVKKALLEGRPDYWVNIF